MKPYFRGIAKKLKAHIDDISSEFGHSGEQGTSNEKIITRFLIDYLPKKYSVGRGKIVAQNDQDTSQIDVIIYDPYLCSPLYTEDGFMVAGIESVYGIAEVKTTLDKSELIDANNKAQSVISKPLLGTVIIRRTPASIERSSGPTAPPIAVCFAFQSKTSLESIKDNLVELDEQRKGFLCLVCILDQGIVYKSRNGWIIIQDPERSLLLFLIYLIEYLKNVPDRSFRLMDYLG